LKPVESRNIAASIRQRLLNFSNSTGEDFGLILTRYGVERLLYRLSQSKYHDQFVLKGAMLFQVWTNAPHRPTRDLDLLGSGDPSLEHCEEVFRELCKIPVEDDGLIFPAETVKAEKIKEEQDYEGVRIKFLARLENIRIPIQVDVGFGDAVTPGLIDYPTLLDMAAPRIQAYPMDTVVAEKLEAIVRLGILNSRMKDFYDIWFLARTFPFDAKVLGGVLRTTFERRKTELSHDGLKILLKDLSSDSAKQTQWQAFLRKSRLAAPDDFTLVNNAIQEFLSFPAALTGAESRTPLSWSPGGPWQRAEELGPESERL
jgi:predicted nucleotidyltransferase component of viral defense system